MAVAHLPAPGRVPRIPLRLASLLGVARFRRAILCAGDVMYVQSPEMGVPLTFGSMRKPVVLHLHGAANPLVASRYIWARKSIMRRVYARLQKRMINASCRVFSVDEAGLRLGGMYLGEEGATRSCWCRYAWTRVCSARETGRRPGRPTVSLPPTRSSSSWGAWRKPRASSNSSTRSHYWRSALHPSDWSSSGTVHNAEPWRREHEDSGCMTGSCSSAGWSTISFHSWLQATDALVLPSAHEGLPTAVLEALACGIPVVATAVGDVPRLVHDGINGLLLHELSPQPLAQALDRVLAVVLVCGRCCCFGQRLLGGQRRVADQRIAVRSGERRGLTPWRAGPISGDGLCLRFGIDAEEKLKVPARCVLAIEFVTGSLAHGFTLPAMRRQPACLRREVCGIARVEDAARSSRLARSQTAAPSLEARTGVACANASTSASPNVSYNTDGNTRKAAPASSVSTARRSRHPR